jgi:hypothetical protein
MIFRGASGTQFTDSPATTSETMLWFFEFFEREKEITSFGVVIFRGASGVYSF